MGDRNDDQVERRKAQPMQPADDAAAEVPEIRIRFLEKAEKDERIVDTTPLGVIRKVLKDDERG